jgi:hypothetical protein
MQSVRAFRMRRWYLLFLVFSLAAPLYSCQDRDRSSVTVESRPQSSITPSTNQPIGVQGPDLNPSSTAEGEQSIQRNYVTTIATSRIRDRYSVVVEAITQSDRSVQGVGTTFRDQGYLGTAYLRKGDSLRVSVIDLTNSGARWESGLLPADQFETIARVERIATDSVVVRRCEVDYGFCRDSVKLFFDLPSKTALGRVTFQPLAVSHFTVMNDRLYSVAAAERIGQVAVEPADHVFAVARYDSGQPLLVSGAEKDAVLATLQPPPKPNPFRNETNFVRSGLLESSLTPVAQSDYYVEIQQSPFFWLSRGAGSNQGGVEGVAERQADAYYLHALPQSTSDEVAQRRPASRAGSSGRVHVAEEIGPFAKAGNRLWFGKTFYDGEGIIGVGALGYFDLEKRSYALFSPQAIADWSTSALLVEEDAIWAGMIRRPEGAVYSGGLLRFEPSTGKTEIYPIKDGIGRIVRWKDALYVGTSNGVYIVRGGQALTRYVFEPALKAGLETVAVH